MTAQMQHGDPLHPFDGDCRATLESLASKASAIHHADPAAVPFTDTERDELLAAIVCMFAHHSTDPAVREAVAHQEPEIEP